jgi:hypothetical protein
VNSKTVSTLTNSLFIFYSFNIAYSNRFSAFPFPPIFLLSILGTVRHFINHTQRFAAWRSG